MFWLITFISNVSEKNPRKSSFLELLNNSAVGSREKNIHKKLDIKSHHPTSVIGIYTTTRLILNLFTSGNVCKVILNLNQIRIAFLAID